jgi:acyl-coenzyme A synthetase/AMP-(fatty) acid ligase
VAATAARVSAAGCRRGALVCRDSYWFAVGLFGLLSARATVVLLPNAQPGTLSARRDAFDHLVGDEPMAGLGSAMMVLQPGRGPAADCRLPPAADCAIDVYTSGSTGAPKCVPRTLAEFEGEVAALDQNWGDQVGGAAVVATVSHQHVYGLVFKILWPLASRRPFATRFYDVWETLLAELPMAAMVISSPAHLTRLGGLGPQAAAGQPRMVVSAGAPLPDAAARDCRRVLGVFPTEIYGSSETGALATRDRDRDGRPWRPLPGNRFIGTADGRLAVCSPYLGADRWLETGDRAVFDPEGGFHLGGRADQVAKVEGKRVSLPETDQTLRALPAIADAAAVVLPGPRGDVLAAVVVPSAAGRTELDRLGAFRFSRQLRHQLAQTQEPAALPRRWRFVEAIPLDGLGKRQAALLHALFAEGPQ